MAQAWHNRKAQPSLQPEGQAYWRATRYQLGKPQASPGAGWRRFTPFASYRPTSSNKRDPEAGPHLSFLGLKEVLQTNPRLYRKALSLFIQKYGLLGLFYEQYSAPILPKDKVWVSPEALIDEHGRLRLVDPSSDGVDLLLDLLQRQGTIEGAREREAVRREKVIALPSELKFATKRFVGLWSPDPSGQELGSRPVPWEEARDEFGALLVLDKGTSTRASVLCTSEPYFGWRIALKDFPSGPYPVSQTLAVRLNRDLAGVSPYAYVNEDGQYERGWRCPSLLRAMYLMLYLDLTGGQEIRICQSRDCRRYYRVGPQARSLYCSPRCANRASTRLGRGQEP